MNPANPSYIDTSRSAKKYREQEEARLNKSGKITVWFFTDNTNVRNAETINFRPKDKISAIARNVKRKFKLNFLINLRITDTENNLRMEKTADESGIKDDMTLVASKEVTETVSSDSVETPERILVKVLRPTSNKPWTFSLEPSTSTTHLYHEVAQQTHTRTHQFYLLRSDDTQVSRYTTIAELNLRLNETLIIKQIEPIRVDTYWTDAANEAQNKITYLDRNITFTSLEPYLAEEFLLDFEFLAEIEGQSIKGDETLGSLARDGGELKICLRRVGQETWYNSSFTNVIKPKEISVMADTNSGMKHITMTAGKQSRVADFAQLLYSTHPELRGRVLEDATGLPYQLTDMLNNIIPASGFLHIRINLVQQYTDEQVSIVLQTIAIERETSSSALVENDYDTFSQW